MNTKKTSPETKQDKYYYTQYYFPDMIRDIYVRYTDEEVEAIRQSIAEADRDTELDGGYKDEAERHFVHSEAIRNLGLTFYAKPYSDGGEMLVDVVYVDLDDYMV